MNRVDAERWSLRAGTVGILNRQLLAGQEEPGGQKRRYICDRCGAEMYEASCKVICPNCGSRFDCSDLSIYLDQQGG